jgi:hypothetical protein
LLLELFLACGHLIDLYLLSTAYTVENVGQLDSVNAEGSETPTKWAYWSRWKWWKVLPSSCGPKGRGFESP